MDRDDIAVGQSAERSFSVTDARVRAFAEDRNSHSSRFYRIINEAPTAIMILVVFLVVMKP